MSEIRISKQLRVIEQATYLANITELTQKRYWVRYVHLFIYVQNEINLPRYLPTNKLVSCNQ